jgi:hypothetical protein
MTRLFNMSKAEAVPDAPTQWLDFIHFHGYITQKGSLPLLFELPVVSYCGCDCHFQPWLRTARFDLYDTVIQYVQSRGRARRADSVVRFHSLS